MLKRHEVEIFDPHPLSNFGLDCGKMPGNYRFAALLESGS